MKSIKVNIIGLCLIACIACIGGSMIYALQPFIAMNYLVTVIAKVIFFGVLPIVYCKFIEHMSLKEMLYLKVDRKQLKTALFLGIGVSVTILIAYVVLKAYIDLDLIASELMTASSISPSTFPLIALYIIFGNSFLEEYFFRGFIFLTLYNKGYIKLAYVFSSLLFALYHVAIFKTWFSPIIIGIALFGLFIGGLIFNYIDTKVNSIVNSWMVHIFADIAIIFIGIKMFYL